MTADDAGLLTTDELLAELGRRYPVMLFAGVRELPGDPKADDVVVHKTGNAVYGLGLAAVARRHLLRHAGPFTECDGEGDG